MVCKLQQLLDIFIIAFLPSHYLLTTEVLAHHSAHQTDKFTLYKDQSYVFHIAYFPMVWMESLSLSGAIGTIGMCTQRGQPSIQPQPLPHHWRNHIFFALSPNCPVWFNNDLFIGYVYSSIVMPLFLLKI